MADVPANFEVPGPGLLYDPKPFLITYLNGVDTVLVETLDALSSDEDLNSGEVPLYPLARAAFGPVQAALEALAARVQALKKKGLRVLAEHGLTGAQLRFKLAVIARENKRLQDAIKLGRIWGGILKRLLEKIDILLESLVKALKADHILGEFKKFLESIIPDHLGGQNSAGKNSGTKK